MPQAVLLLTFNRPDTTQRVLHAVRQARPARLYVAADGPRPGHPDDPARCAETRRAATDVDWDCQVSTLFRDHNLGTRKAVTGALDWFFEHEPEGIILEDDCLPDPTFFDYCDQLLDRYRDNPNVALVSGNDYHPPEHPRDTSYTFTRYTFIWGWATWRRAWQYNDPSMVDWPQLRETSWLDDLSDGHEDFNNYWTARFDDTYRGEVDSWAYVWTYSCWRAGMLSTMPTAHLVANVGFGEDATHTTADNWRAHLPTAPMTFPLTHPPEVARDRDVDRWADLHVYRTKKPKVPLWRRAAAKVPGVRPAVRWLRQHISSNGGA